MAVLWTNPIMALSHNVNCVTLGTSYAEFSIFSSGCSIFQKSPIVSIDLRLHTAKKRAIKCCLEKVVLERKEFEFETSFDDYLKAMESVQSAKGKGPRTSKKRGENGELKVVDEKDSKGIKISRKAENDADLVIQVEEDVLHDKKTPLKKWKNPVSNKSKTSKSELLDVERAAFKTMGEVNSVYDKPRVSRMDMEERIQKLAKW